MINTFSTKYYRLGPPDFHPPTSSSPEENLTKEYVQFGYKETVDGIKVRLAEFSYAFLLCHLKFGKS